MLRSTCLTVCAALILVLTGCSTEPKSETKKQTLHDEVEATLKKAVIVDPAFQSVLDHGYGYVVFPSVGKGGFVVGGSYGHGEVYEQGRMVGFSDISQATVGLQAGGQSFSQIVIFENKAALDNLKYGKLKFSANASAVALKAGAATSAKYTDGVIIFVVPQGGLMVEASVGGQSFGYQPK